MGTKHPNPLVAPMRAVEASRELAARSACSIRTSSSTTGCPTTSARAISPKPTSASARIASTSRRTSRSARACSTTSGRACRSSAPTATSSRDLVRREGLGASSRPAMPRRWRTRSNRLLGDDAARAAARAALGRLGREMHWSRVVAPLARFLEAPASAADHAVGLARVRADLQGGYRLSKWLKRTALRARRDRAARRAAQAARPRPGARWWCATASRSRARCDARAERFLHAPRQSYTRHTRHVCVPPAHMNRARACHVCHAAGARTAGRGRK